MPTDNFRPIYIYIHIHAYTHLHTTPHRYIHLHTRVSPHMWTCTCITYIYTHMHIHWIHMYLHTHEPPCVWTWKHTFTYIIYTCKKRLHNIFTFLLSFAIHGFSLIFQARCIDEVSDVLCASPPLKACQWVAEEKDLMLRRYKSLLDLI